MATQLSQGVAEMTHEKRVTEKQLNILAAKLGAEWESLAIDLDLTQGEIHECKADNKLSVRTQKFAMLMKWRARAGKNATIAKLVQKLRAARIDEDKFAFLLPPNDQTGTGLEAAATPVGPGQTAPPTPVDPSLLQLLKHASAIVQKTNPGVAFTPDPRGGKEEEERMKKLKDWELKQRVENFSSSINYSVDYEGFSEINDNIKSVCLVEHPDGYGTGFLIGPKYVITANHVWEDAYTSFSQVNNPQRFLVHFHISSAKRLTFIFKPRIVTASDAKLDYAILEIHPVSPTLPSVSETMQSEGICPLGAKIATTVGNEDIVVVVGHPAGGRKRVDFCAVAGVDAVTSHAITLLGPPDDELRWPQEPPYMGSYHHTSVMFEGSSGSPCFNKHANVVFMHTCGFRPYIGKESIVEMGVLLSRVKTDAQGKLPSEVFTEIFGS
ncbi:uncharacterized protein LOC144914637 isoform X2 [Branchiostoma floridae x Branchiostoma belcheri]